MAEGDAQYPWRRPIASLNYLLTSHVWRQDHNGFSHQDPGFIDHVVNKKADVVRVYLPPDANCLLSVADHCLRSRNYVNVIVAGKQPELQWLDMDAAVKHCTAGLGIWDWASNDEGCEPDVVMACCGDVPTLETLAAVDLLHQLTPDLKIRVVNVVDLMTLQPQTEHPHGLSDRDFDAIFTTDKPIVFAFHGYPVADSSADLPAHQPRQPARARVQGRRHHHNAVRHDRAQRSGSFPPGRRRHRSCAAAAQHGGLPQTGFARPPDRTSRVRLALRRRSAGNSRLEVAGEVKTLVINAGSSSFKCWFQDVPDQLPRERLQPAWRAQAGAGANLGLLLRGLWEGENKAIDSPAEIEVVGHRIVHGGPKYRASVLITPEVRAGIAEQAEFAPAHNRIQLEAIRTVDRVLGPDVPQVAVFDTAFHATLEPSAYVYAGPYSWLEQGIRRYGFHGISVQYATRRSAELLGTAAGELRLIVCHLGNGASVTAVSGGKSVDTSMGLTPLEGLMMGTRSGSIDPSILVYLIRRFGYSADQLDDILNKQSGLLGVSGLSGDMRETLASH